MLFSAWSDTGDCIKAYLVPDSFSGRPSLDFFSEGIHRGTVAPNGVSEHVGGRHETGEINFIVDGSMIEGLAGFVDLEVRDADSGVLIYRRPPTPTLQERLFRLETHLFPLWRLDRAVKRHFTYWYDRIDQHTVETARQILLFRFFGSLYSSGRLLFRNFDYDIHPDQKTAIILHDPYEELAERLLIFKRLGADANRLLNDRDSMLFAPIIGLVRELKTFDEGELRRVLGGANLRHIRLLSDPLTRQIICATPDEPTPRGGVSKTLRTLSEFDVVGIRRESRMFSAAIAELLGIPDLEMPTIEDLPELREVARNLRTVRWIEGLIEHDLEVYESVASALAATERASGAQV